MPCIMSFSLSIGLPISFALHTVLDRLIRLTICSALALRAWGIRTQRTGLRQSPPLHRKTGFLVRVAECAIFRLMYSMSVPCGHCPYPKWIYWPMTMNAVNQPSSCRRWLHPLWCVHCLSDPSIAIRDIMAVPPVFCIADIAPRRTCSGDVLSSLPQH